jgi:dipeptidyl aminopeptidase/acylaminoacyl peptidase
MRLLIALSLAASCALAQTSPTPPTRAETLLPAPEVPDPARFNQFFQPLRTNAAAISPDGKYVAFTQREDDKVFVITAEIDRPGQALGKVLVADNASSTGMLEAFQREDQPAQVRWMRWVSPTRVVVETNRATILPGRGWSNISGAVLGFNFDGSDARVLVTPKDIAEVMPGDNSASTGPNRFSIRRDNREFEDRVHSVDRPMDRSTTGGKFGDETIIDSDPLAQKPQVPDVVIPSVRPGVSALALQVLRVDPAKPGFFQMIATGAELDNGSHSIRLLSVDASNGQMTTLANDFVPNNRDFLLDQQGNLRVTLPNGIIPGFPHRYEYLGRRGEARRSTLGSVIAPEVPDAFTVSPENYFDTRELPLGFDRNGDVLYFASNRNRDTFAVFSHNFADGKIGAVSFQNPNFDLIGAPFDAFPPDTLVFDPHTGALAGIRFDSAMRTATWIAPELREAQATIERLLPGRAVDLVDWDRSAKRFVAFTQGPADAGAFYVYDREAGKVSEFARRAPWFDEKRVFATVPFAFRRTDGVVISGLVTVPTSPRLKPYPMVIVCPDQPWQRVRSDFRPEIQALTDMGFAVVQLNARGTWGQGKEHRAALRAGYDRAQVDDVVSAIDELEKRFLVNRDRVALFGRGHGGFIALRALQEHPERFRCAIAIDAPVNLERWVEERYWNDGSSFLQLVRGAFGTPADLAAAPLVKQPGRMVKPFLVLAYPGPENGPRRAQYLAAKSFIAAAQRTTQATLRDLPSDYQRALPKAQAEAFAWIEEFLNLNIYSYRTGSSEMKQVELLKPDAPTPPKP